LWLFLFPSSIGPYSAVNGPATAFKSAQYSLFLRVSITCIVIQAVMADDAVKLQTIQAAAVAALKNALMTLVRYGCAGT
jgi:hypothetical protein